MAKCKYIDSKPIFLPELKNYKNGIALPNESNIIEVTESELKNLLRYKNGNNNIFIKVETESKKKNISLHPEEEEV